MAAFANPQLMALMQARALQQRGINPAAPVAGVAGGLPGQQWAAALGQPTGGAIGGLPVGAPGVNQALQQQAAANQVAAGGPPVSSLAAQGIAPGWQQALANIGQTSGMMPVTGPASQQQALQNQALQNIQQQQALQAIQGALPLAGGSGPTPQGAQTPGLTPPGAANWQQALARMRSRV